MTSAKPAAGPTPRRGRSHFTGLAGRSRSSRSRSPYVFARSAVCSALLELVGIEPALDGGLPQPLGHRVAVGVRCPE